VYDLTGQKDKVLPLLEKALELDPENPGVLVAMGDYYLDEGDLDLAERYAREALTIFAQNQDALVLMGYVLLRRGRTEEAREHAIWALRVNPAARGPLRLMASVKARSNPFLGLWWRGSVWMGSLGQSKAIMVLIGAYAAYRVLTIVLRGTIPDPYVNAIQFAWLGIVVYTWVGPGLFRRMLTKELSKVSLRKDF
jgi:tetratricopeptide (TPR) repeat protein